MMKELPRPAPLLHLCRATGPIGPNFSFPRRKIPLKSLFYGPLLWGRALTQSGCEQMPLSLLASLATAFFQPCPTGRGKQHGAAEILRPTLPAAVNFPMKLRGDCHLSYRA